MHNDESHIYDILISKVTKIKDGYLIGLNKNNFGDGIKAFSPKLFCIK